MDDDEGAGPMGNEDAAGHGPMTDEQALTALFASLVADPPPSQLSSEDVIRVAIQEQHRGQVQRSRQLKFGRNLLVAAAFVALLVVVVAPQLRHTSSQTAVSSSAASPASSAAAAAAAPAAEAPSAG